METTQGQNKIQELFKNPTALIQGLQNPSKLGLDIYRSLSARHKQYLTIAAGAGLIIYGLTLGKKNK